MKNHFVVALVVSSTFLSAACSESIPNITGTYSENTAHLAYTYTFEKLDETKYKMARTAKPLKSTTSPVITEKIYLFAGNSKFCEEASNSDCFNFDENQGIRFDGRSEFIKKAN